jgi:hypothetical protein
MGIIIGISSSMLNLVFVIYTANHPSTYLTVVIMGSRGEDKQYVSKHRTMKRYAKSSLTAL